MKKQFTILIIFAVALLSGCDAPERGNTSSFTLPEGNAAHGAELLVKFQCLSCHALEGFERPDVLDESDISIALGGKVTRLKTYQELVMSIINPSHRIAHGYDPQIIVRSGSSIMPNYNDVMTVTDLIDLVTFLEGQYELQPFEYTEYGLYY
ncbi:cytochrome C [Photobacterium nomapromontoriensis]|uniref:cytochrome C n=1 Tax=Photobacterium nomapromontoriensis TaxID=2910237 RepID=UPI003D0FE61F